MNEKDYLKDLIELETEKTRLGSIYYILNKFTKEFISEYIKGLEKDYNNTCKEIEIKRKNEKKKVNNKEIISNPEKPEKPVKQEIKGAPVVLFLVGIIEVFMGLAMDLSFVTILGGFVALGSLLGVYAQFSTNKKYNEDMRKYENNLYEYNQKLKEHNSGIKERDAKLEKIDEKYNKEIEKKNDEQQRKLNELKNRNNIILNNLKNNILKVNKILNEKYNLKNIPTKYRNISSVSTLYSYFESNLISDLEGAFAVYEQKGENNKSIKELSNELVELKEKNYQIYLGLNIINNSVLKIEDIISKLKTKLEDEEYMQEEIANCYSDIETECKQKTK